MEDGGKWRLKDNEQHESDPVGQYHETYVHYNLHNWK